MSITSLANIKLMLDITDSSEDTRLTLLQTIAEANVKNYCQNNFEQATYTEFFTGSGTRAIVLRQVPVWSITNVWLDNYAYYGQSATPFASNTLLVSGTDYALEKDKTLSDGTVVSQAGLLIRINTIWPELNPIFYPGRLTQEFGPALGNVKVIYVAGYTPGTMPMDVQGAVGMLVAGFRRSLPFGGLNLTSESITDYSYTLTAPTTSKGSFPEIGAVRQILNKYKQVAFGEPSVSGPGQFGY